MPVFQIGPEFSSQFSKRSSELMFAFLVHGIQMGVRDMAHITAQDPPLDIPGSGNIYC